MSIPMLHNILLCICVCMNIIFDIGDNVVYTSIKACMYA